MNGRSDHWFPRKTAADFKGGRTAPKKKSPPDEEGL
jgi:hypothetical protein